MSDPSIFLNHTTNDEFENNVYRCTVEFYDNDEATTPMSVTIKETRSITSGTPALLCRANIPSQGEYFTILDPALPFEEQTRLSDTYSISPQRAAIAIQLQAQRLDFGRQIIANAIRNYFPDYNFALQNIVL